MLSGYALTFLSVKELQIGLRNPPGAVFTSLATDRGKRRRPAKT